MADRDYVIWLIAMLKGGVRKSTTAMMTAFALARRNHDVLVIDADAGTQGGLFRSPLSAPLRSASAQVKGPLTILTVEF